MATMLEATGSFLFTTEQELFRESVRGFSTKKLAPGYLRRAQSDEGCRDELLLCAEQGLVGMAISEEHGGQGADFISSGIACEEVARGDFNVAYLIFATTVMGALIERFCPGRADLLPGIASGAVWPCLALTETEAGSDAAAISTRAERVDGGWRLFGEKTSVSGGPNADVAIVFVRTDPGRGPEGVSALVVDLDNATIGRQVFRDPGFRPIGRGSLSFDGTFVAEENLLGEEGGGFGIVMSEFDYTRSLIGLMAIGAAETALDMAVGYTKQRFAFGRPVSRNQGVSFTVAEHATKLEAARWLCYRSLALREAGRRHTREGAMIKWWVPQLAFEAIQDSIVLHGHVAWSEEMPLQALLRDVSGLQIGDGTPQVQKLVIAREIFGRDFV